MSSSSVAESILVVDVGEINTRALLFDVVDGYYRFVASGSGPTTVGSPLHDVGHGVQMALDHLQDITGRVLVGEDERIKEPAHADGPGVDAFAVVMSAGAPLKVVVVGLQRDISVKSTQRLAETTYSQIVDTFYLNDHRNTQARLNSIVRLRPDIILIAGGTENGSRQSVLKLIEPVGLACYLLPDELKPQVLYAGNQALAKEVEALLMPLTSFTSAPNIRPTLEVERSEPAQAFLARVYRQSRIRQIPGVQELDTWAGGLLMPAATALGRMVRFLSLEDGSKGVLGVDVGVSATTIAAAFDGHLCLGVYPQYGLGDGSKVLMAQNNLRDITRWLYIDIPDEEVRAYVYNKAIYPASLPATARDLAIEQALARQAIRLSLEKLAPCYQNDITGPYPGGVLPRSSPAFEPIIASGSVLTNGRAPSGRAPTAPALAQSLLMLLDAIQPTGITTLILDQNNLVAALGAAASINPTMAVQVMDSGALLNLGAAICPLSDVRMGTPVLRVHIHYESGSKEKFEIKKGELSVLPLAFEQAASLHLKPLHGADIGMGAGRGCRVNRVVGGALGLIIDARGRPLRLPKDPAKRRALHIRWLRVLGG